MKRSNNVDNSSDYQKGYIDGITDSTYTEEKLGIIKKTLPPLTTCTAETGPLNLDFPAYTWTKLHGFAVQSHETPVEMEDVLLKDAYDMAGVYPTMNDNHPFSSLWTFHYNHAGENWCVAGRFATIPLNACSIKLENLQLNPNDSYHVFDFWKEEYLGIVTGEIAVRALSLGECQILGFRKVKSVPQFVASSRHVSMDAVSVQDIKWEQGRLIISVQGVAGTTERYYVAIPNGYEMKNACAKKGALNVAQSEKLLVLEIEFTETEALIVVHFEKNGG